MNRLLPVWGIIGLIALLAAILAFSPQQTTEATLTVATGQVIVLRVSDTPLVRQPTELRAAAGDSLAIQAADTIQLDDASSATIWLADGVTVELSPGTVLEMTELVDGPDSFRVRLTLLAGKTINRVGRFLGVADVYEVRTPSSVASVRGTVFTVQVLSATTTYINVDEGRVAVNMEGQEVLVNPGEEVTSTLGEPLVVQPQGGPPEPTPTGETSGVTPSVTATTAIPTGTTTQTLTAVATRTVLATTPTTRLTAVPSLTGTPTPPSFLTTITPPPLPTLPPPTVITISPVPTTAPATPTTRPIVPTATAVSTSTAVPPTATPEPPTASPTPEPELVTLCHTPPGQPDNPQTIQVPPDQVQGHLDHGDYLGPCR